MLHHPVRPRAMARHGLPDHLPSRQRAGAKTQQLPPRRASQRVLNCRPGGGKREESTRGGGVAAAPHLVVHHEEPGDLAHRGAGLEDAGVVEHEHGRAVGARAGARQPHLCGHTGWRPHAASARHRAQGRWPRCAAPSTHAVRCFSTLLWRECCACGPPESRAAPARALRLCRTRCAGGALLHGTGAAGCAEQSCSSQAAARVRPLLTWHGGLVDAAHELQRGGVAHLERAALHLHRRPELRKAAPLGRACAREVARHTLSRHPVAPTAQERGERRR